MLYNTLQDTHSELLTASQSHETLEAYLEYHTGGDSAKHLISFYDGEWLGAVFTLDNGVTLDTYRGKLTLSTASTAETRWIQHDRLETALDDIFRDIWETGDIDPLDVMYLH